MKTVTWIQIIGGILFTAIAFLGANVFDMKGILSSVKTQVEATESRVSRIAETLPEVKARVAWEEINHAIDGFVTVSNPMPTNGENWITTASVYDRDNSELKVYSVTLDKAHKNYASYVIAGKLKAENPHDSSFSELVRYSSNLEHVVMIPDSINPNTSFVFRSANPSDMTKFIGTLTKEDPKTVKVGKIRNWKELTEKLDAVANQEQTQDIEN